MAEPQPSQLPPRRPPPAQSSRRGISRRQLLIGSAGAGGVVAVGGIGYALVPNRLKVRLGLGPDPYIPDAPEGQVRLQSVYSAARGTTVDLFTAVPAGYGDGAGLPVVVVLHGGSATASKFRGFGFGRFLTQAVRDGAEPFVLAGADGGVLRWEKDPLSHDDPQRMVVEEMPRWLGQRGFDADRRALWGWSMGGCGTLRLVETYPEWSTAAAVFSPAIGLGDAVFGGVDALTNLPLAIWCGTEDPFYSATKAFVASMPRPPQRVSYSKGAHTRVFWNDQTLAAFRFLAEHLSQHG